MEHYARTDELLRTEFGVPARPFDGDAVCELEPALKPGLGGGWLYETRRPPAAGPADALLADAARTARGEIREGMRGPRVRRGTGGDGPGGRDRAAAKCAADAFVVAAGAWSPLLNDHLGCRLPIQPGKGYSVTTARPAGCPKRCR